MSKTIKCLLGIILLLAILVIWGALKPVDPPILVYHDINPHPINDMQVTPEKFKNDMLALKQSGYHPIFFSDLLLARANKKPLPAKPVIITFDDGYLSNYTYAYPILKELHFKATISIVVSMVGQSPWGTPHFSWAQAREMAASGLIQFGMHTYNLHGTEGVLPQKNEPAQAYRQRLTNDFNLATKLMTENLGVKPDIFCYPEGYYTNTAENLLHQLGYKITLSFSQGHWNGTYLLRRTVVKPNTGVKFAILKNRILAHQPIQVF